MGMRSAKQANRRYFRQAYRSGQHGWEVEQPLPYAVDFLRRLKHLVPVARLLDVGCGEGRHAIAAALMDFKVTAIDYELLALRRARQFAKRRRAKGITFRKADVLRLTFSESCFDIVLDYGCLHHQKKSDWLAYKGNIVRVLRPRGFYVLSVFSRAFPLFHGSRRPWHIAQGAYRRYFTRRDILELFGREFEVLELAEEEGKHAGFWHALMRRRGEPPSPSSASDGAHGIGLRKGENEWTSHFSSRPWKRMIPSY
jgi:SAM-dependent methyltransferase